MRQLNLRVEDEVDEAFRRFCERQHTSPSELLGSVIGFYGRGEMLTQEAEHKVRTQEEVLVELGRIISDMQRFAQANGEFAKAVADLLKPYGVELGNLWPRWKEPGEKTRLKN